MLHSGICSITFRDHSVDGLIALCQKAGIEGIEWGGDVHVRPGDAETARSVREKTLAAGLKVCSYGSYYKCDAEDGAFGDVLESAEALGAPLVIQPLLTARESQDQLGAAIEEAFRRGDIEQIRDLAALAPERKAQLRQQVRVPEGEREFVGLRLWRDRHIVFETTAGELELRLRPEHAPNTVYHVLGLAEGGLYDGTIFHRIINSDGQGRRFIIQGGDPLGLGSGGPGFRIDYEPSSLTHDYGVVSLARRPFEPNSGGSQFFICLSREACSALDGAYTAFAEVVRGVETIETLSRVPVGPLDPDDPSSRMERPLDPPRIVRARVIDAPPLPLAPQRVSEPVSAGER